ncbi:ubiquitin-specific protease ubp15 [Dionaea muscipula]
MLEPREADIPALFLVLVVLPLVTYILLGKWSEVSKRKERINLLAQLAAEESLRAEAMASASVIPLASPPKIGIHECALCHGPATTRCSRCKSIRYCSGKCQIIHWRQGHKEECLPLESFSPFLKSASVPESAHLRAFSKDETFPQVFVQPVQEEAASDGRCPLMDLAITEATAVVDAIEVPVLEIKNDKHILRKSTRERSTNEDIHGSKSSEDTLKSRTASLSSSSYNPAKEWPKLRGSGPVNSGDGFSGVHEMKNTYSISHGNSASRSGIQQSQYQSRNVSDPKASNSSKLPDKAPREQTWFGKERDGHVFDNPIGRKCYTDNGARTNGFMKMMGLKKVPKVSRKDSSAVCCDNHKRVKMLFPYDVFTGYFQYENFNLAPRGLLNCGNSCYANAVLQCLTCTKPLVVYLLKRTHSSACCIKTWCLMCELEQLVMMLRESMDPLSPSGILLHLRTINSQIGDGSQEDAHEFLRLLVTSMQSICLEEMGGEKLVDPCLQETTFIQHTFGGRLRSKVKCVRCKHESERYENIMDLTLEIFGRVESLEDALTQFTTVEDLDGDNKYRCGSCASYVRARKQLSIDEAPNILTIVLKRFQEGSYGKINKYVRFPDMLDMIPYMTGTNDIPPLYVLYAMVVHMDMLNASFSGHYVSYVKDLQGNWFRVDDAEVQPVPMSQVMSEGAYILFYMRSFPRPPSAHLKSLVHRQAPSWAKQCASNNVHRLSREHRENIGSETSPGPGYTNHSNDIHRSANRRFPPMMRTYAEPAGVEFSEATSSDWSLFTSSDEASFTTESTRDSFSAADYVDTCNIDPVASFLNTLYPREHTTQRTISCRIFSGTAPTTRFVSEEKGYMFDSYHNPAYQSPNEGSSSRQVPIPSDTFLRDNGYPDFGSYEHHMEDEHLRTSTRCRQ